MTSTDAGEGQNGTAVCAPFCSQLILALRIPAQWTHGQQGVDTAVKLDLTETTSNLISK